jgi:hypothetical protein
MSNTLRLTPLHPADYDYVDTERNAHGAGVKILDHTGLEDELPDTLVDQMDTRVYTDTGEYPRKEWDLLLGFTTWGADPEDGPAGGADYHNVSNTGPTDFAEILARVSGYTEPFVVWMTDFEGVWPHAAEIDGEDRPGKFYRLEAKGGIAELTEVYVAETNAELVDQYGD